MTTEDRIALVILMNVGLTVKVFTPLAISSRIDKFHDSGNVPIAIT